MSTEKEVERDIDSMEVGGNDGFFVGFNDSMELGKKYGTQLGIMHVLELALMALFKKSLKKDQIWAKLMPLMNASNMYFSSLTRNAENANDDFFFVFNTSLDLFKMPFQVDLFPFFQLLFWFALKECQLRKMWKET